MQLMTPLFTLVAMMVTLGQESKLSFITKDYVTIQLITNIDNMFAKSLPKDILENAKEINKNKIVNGK